MEHDKSKLMANDVRRQYTNGLQLEDRMNHVARSDVWVRQQTSTDAACRRWMWQQLHLKAIIQERHLTRISDLRCPAKKDDILKQGAKQ